jgi:hypothetical protein
MPESRAGEGGSERDRRSTVPPAEHPPEEEPERGDTGEAHGPLGNPASDPETLSHRQQEEAERPRREPDA